MAPRKSKPKKQVQKKAPRRAPSRQIVIPNEAVERVCSVVDPFCSAANGARWSSQGNVPTVTYQARNLYPVTLDATGTAVVYFSPANQIQQGFYFSADNTSPYTPSCASGDPTLTANINAMSQMRVVSAGMRWWYTGPMTGGGGSAIVLEYDSYSSMSAVNTDASAAISLTQAPRTWATDIRKSGSWYSKPNTSTALEFLSNGASAAERDCRTVCALVLRGPASTSNIVYVEFVVNYEFALDATAMMGRMGHVAPYNAMQARLNDAADSVYSKVSGYFAGTADAFAGVVKSTARQALTQSIRAGMSAAAGYFGGPGVGYATYRASGAIMDVD